MTQSLFRQQYKLAVQGSAQSQCWVGYSYDKGRNDVMQNDKTAVHWYTKAAKQNYAVAQHKLGLCYRNGRGVLQNDETAVHWYTKAAEQNYADAQNNLGLCYENGRGVDQNDETAVHWYTKAAEQNNAWAQYNLGRCYQNGKGVNRNDETAVQWFTKAAEENNAGAQNKLGLCYENGLGVLPSDETAVHWYKKAAERNFADAEFNLGNCFYNGKGVIQNDKTAVLWYTKAAKQNHAHAQYNLGMCYKNGLGVEKDWAMAVHWYQKAADQGQEDAKRWLGRAKEELAKQQQKEKQSVFLEREQVTLSAEEEAMVYRFCKMLILGLPLEAVKHKMIAEKVDEKIIAAVCAQSPEKEETARRFCEMLKMGLPVDAVKHKMVQEHVEERIIVAVVEVHLAQIRNYLLGKAYDGDTNAQFELGMALQEGNREDLGIIKQDQQLGLELLLRAAEGGHLAAQCAVAKCYETGTGGTPEQDEHMAFSWYEMAAEEGSVDGMFHCGRCHENGIGVDAVDFQQACNWYERAFKAGYKEARGALVKAKAHLLGSKKAKEKEKAAQKSSKEEEENKKAASYEKRVPNPVFMDPPSGLNMVRISAILDGYGSITIQDDQFENKLAQLEELEVTLVKWLALLAEKEVDSGQKSGPQELVWVKLTARVYHCLVPMWQQKFESTFDSSEMVDVFISHTGVDKDDYASSLSGYLSDKGVSTFLDRRSLRPGDNPQESMIEALVTCRRMWCVVTKEFVGNWYPMRELWIGYTRYQREDRNRFCLIVDCLEKQRSRSGAWMDQLLGSVQALEPHDEHGERYPFPTMIPARNAEGFFERYVSIAHQELADGKSILPTM